MNKVILIHGTGGDGDVFWFPYVKAYAKQQRMEVQSPSFPDSNTPKLNDWLEYAGENIAFDANTVLIGHSLGCSFILSLLQRTNVKIKKAILVAGPYDKDRENVGYQKIKDFLEAYDWQKIKGHCHEFVFIHSTNDLWDCDEENADYAFNQLGGVKVIMEGQGHFGSTVLDQPYEEFPFIITQISK